MKTYESLMDEIAAALQFPDYFGENWNALTDCMSDMNDRMPGDAYIIVVVDAQDVLVDESEEDIRVLLKVLHNNSEWWSKPVIGNPPFDRNAIPFHTLFECSPSVLDRVYERYRRATKYSIKLIR